MNRAGKLQIVAMVQGSSPIMKYLEDFQLGETETIAGYELRASEIMTFARRWDPQPMHTDPEAAKALPFGGLIAAGSHLLAISVRQLVSRSAGVAIIAGLSWDEVRFLEPARPGDVLSLTRECIEVRPSGSKPDRGIVRNRIILRNQRGNVLVSYIDTLLVARRPEETKRPPLAGAGESSTAQLPLRPELDHEQITSLLRDCWSARTSSQWSERNPSRGQCGVTALVINDHLGGEILKTRVGESWHFYNRIDGRRLDLTSAQFPDPIEYLDIVSSREEALADATEAQYRELARCFLEAIERRNGQALSRTARRR